MRGHVVLISPEKLQEEAELGTAPHPQPLQVTGDRLQTLQ